MHLIPESLELVLKLGIPGFLELSAKGKFLNSINLETRLAKSIKKLDTDHVLNRFQALEIPEDSLATTSRIQNQEACLTENSYDESSLPKRNHVRFEHKVIEHSEGNKLTIEE